MNVAPSSVGAAPSDGADKSAANAAETPSLGPLTPSFYPIFARLRHAHNRLAPMPRKKSLVSQVEAALAARADPARAPEMQAYMKSAMPFLGVDAPTRRAICRELARESPLPDAGALRATVLGLWERARYREQRYAAVDLLLDRRHARFLDLDALPLLERLIVEGAWWDYVDALAAHGLGALLARYPGPMKKTLRRWARDEDHWKRRAAILAQLRHKHDVDRELLYACIEPSLGEADFFLRKAIGWALRQLAWTDPAEVSRYVRENRSRLSPLSIREALKNVSAGERG